MLIAVAPIRYAWRRKATYIETQVIVAQNVYQTFFSDLVGWKRFYYVTIKQTNDEHANKECGLKMSFHDTNYDGSLPMVDATKYYVTISDEGLLYATTRTLISFYQSIQDDYLIIEGKVFDALGTDQELEVKVVFEELEVI